MKNKSDTEYYFTSFLLVWLMFVICAASWLKFFAIVFGFNFPWFIFHAFVVGFTIITIEAAKEKMRQIVRKRKLNRLNKFNTSV